MCCTRRPVSEGSCTASPRLVTLWLSCTFFPTAFCRISERMLLGQLHRIDAASLARPRLVRQTVSLLHVCIRAPTKSSCHAVDGRRGLLTSGGGAFRTNVKGDFSLVGLTPWSLGQGLHLRLSSLETVVSFVSTQKEISHGITQRPPPKLCIPWLFLSSELSRTTLPPSTSPRKISNNKLVSGIYPFSFLCRC